MQSYPEDLYDSEDYIVEKRKSELIREMRAHILIGMGLGIALTLSLAMIAAWIMGA